MRDHRLQTHGSATNLRTRQVHVLGGRRCLRSQVMRTAWLNDKQVTC